MIVINLEMPKEFVVKTGRGPIICFVVLQKENLDRMKEADPADLQLIEYMKGPMLNAPLKQLDLVIAYEDDLETIVKFQRERDIAGLLRWLERGRKILPGDVTPPVPLSKN